MVSTTRSSYSDTNSCPSTPLRWRRHLLFFLIAMTMAALILFSAGCATVGRDFPADRVSEIRMGVTTQSEIREIFGEPWRVGIEDGQRTWTYGKYRYTPFGESRTQDLVVRFDKNDLVNSYTFNKTADRE
jgi:outer membrane protein assembly factor BamE (lipoprotein component of BamABCDE complex)